MSAAVSVVPSAAMLAVVDHAEPPTTVPDDLAAYVVPDDEGDRGWLLTDDALAFGDPALPARFGEWRAMWERMWVLDPYTSLTRLAGLVADHDRRFGRRSEFERLVPGAGDDGTWVVRPESLDELIAEVGRVRDIVAALGQADGYGFVDATPGHRSTGLARTWSPVGGIEMLAAHGPVCVVMHPERGLTVEVTPGGSSKTVVETVDSVVFGDDDVVVRAETGELRLTGEQAQSLRWIVPGSLEWRVRRVPHAVVWARTFAGLDECCRYALAIEQPVRLTTRRPFS